MAKILVVDDSASMRQMVKFTLTSAGHEVDDATDGNSALEKINSDRYEAIISDVNMPGMSGIELIEKTRQIAGYKFVPILLLTTESGGQKKEDAKKAGATGWIIKPFQPDTLINTMGRVLR